MGGGEGLKGNILLRLTTCQNPPSILYKALNVWLFIQLIYLHTCKTWSKKFSTYILTTSPSASSLSGSLLRGEKWHIQLLTETHVGKAIPAKNPLNYKHIIMYIYDQHFFPYVTGTDKRHRSQRQIYQWFFPILRLKIPNWLAGKKKDHIHCNFFYSETLYELTKMFIYITKLKVPIAAHDFSQQEILPTKIEEISYQQKN